MDSSSSNSSSSSSSDDSFSSSSRSNFKPKTFGEIFKEAKDKLTSDERFELLYSTIEPTNDQLIHDCLNSRCSVDMTALNAYTSLMPKIRKAYPKKYEKIYHNILGKIAFKAYEKKYQNFITAFKYNRRTDALNRIWAAEKKNILNDLGSTKDVNYDPQIEVKQEDTDSETNNGSLISNITVLENYSASHQLSEINNLRSTSNITVLKTIVNNSASQNMPDGSSNCDTISYNDFTGILTSEVVSTQVVEVEEESQGTENNFLPKSKLSNLEIISVLKEKSQI